jgi:tetratricopeptide (TPR) repeat protein
MIGQRIHHYEITEKLGEGGMGVVYKAQDTRLHRTVALKFLHPSITSSPEDQERLVNEARAAAGLSHPNICTVYEINEIGGRTFIVMQYVEGSTLRDRVLSGRIEVADALRFLSEIADGLKQAHAQGIVHRDMKSSNIMITPTGRAVIMDFGLARPVEHTRAEERFSSRGTSAYMSPEQARGEAVDQRADIWSLGVVLYEMLAGRLPFRGDYEQAVLYSILNEAPRPIDEFCPGLPARVREVVDTCLRKDPRDRYQSLDALLAALRRAHDVATGARRDGPWSRARVAALAAAAVLTLVAAFVTYDFIRGRQADGRVRVPIAVIDFNNETGESSLDGLSGMLITALEQSRRLQVMTRSRMLDVLKTTGQAEVARVDESLGQRVCQVAGVDVLVIPTIRRFGDLYTIDLKVLDTRQHRYIYTTKQEGRGEESIPHMIDEIAHGIRIDLREPTESVARTSPVGHVTTGDLAAYQAYFEGETLLNSLDFSAASEKFAAAIARDSTFALAWYRLAYTEWWSRGRQQEAKEHIAYAVANLDRVPIKERFLVRALNAALSDGFEAQLPILTEMRRLYPDDKEMLFGLGDAEFHSSNYDSAIVHFEAALAIDPHMERSLQHLAWALQAVGRGEDALVVARRWVEATHSVDAYEYLAACHIRASKPDEAMTVLAEARRRFPQSAILSVRMASALFMQRRTDEARLEIEEAARILGDRRDYYTRNELWRMQALVIDPYLGRYAEARRQMDAGIRGLGEANVDSLALMSMRVARVSLDYWAYQDPARVRAALAPLRPDLLGVAKGDMAQSIAVLHLVAGDSTAARAFERAGEGKMKPQARRVIGAVRAALSGDCGPAAALARADAKELGPGGRARETLHYVAGTCLLETGNPRAAIAEFRAIVDVPLLSPEAAPVYPSAWFQLGRACEAAGDARQARAAYETLLATWKDADEDLPQLQEARTRLRALRSAM